MAEAQWTSDEDILQCPLCCCIYENPRQLPCLHTFCLKCLQSHFTCLPANNNDTDTESHNGYIKLKRYMCPMCSKDFIIDPKLNPLEFFIGLPSNNVLSMLIQQDKFKQHHNFCDLCIKSDKKITAEFYCYDCEMAFCNMCERYHKKFPSISNHSIVPLDKSNLKRSVVPGSNIFCEYHTHLKLDFFCFTHQKPCCKLCIKLDHKHCKDITSIREATKDIDKTEEISNLLHCVNELILMYVEIKQDRHKNIERLTNQTSANNFKIDCLGNSIIEHFKTLIQNMKDQNDSLLSKSISKLEHQVSDIDHSLKSAINIKTLLRVCSNNSSNIQILQQLDRIFQSCQKQHDALEEFRKQLFGIEHDVHFKCTIENVRERHRELGSLEVNETNIENISLYRKMKKTKTVFINPNEHNRETRQRIFGSPHVRHAKYALVTGVIVHPNLNVIFVDNSENVIHIYDPEGNLVLKKLLFYKPFDLAVLDNDTIAISFPEQCETMKFSLNNTQLQGWKKSQESCYGIHLAGDKLFVSCINHIEIFSMESNTEYMIQKVRGAEGYLYVSHDSHDIYYTVNSHLVCMSLKGKKLYHENSDDRIFSGITMGIDGHIYAADSKNKTVVMLSKTLSKLHEYSVEFTPSSLVASNSFNKLYVSHIQKMEEKHDIQSDENVSAFEFVTLFEFV